MLTSLLAVAVTCANSAQHRRNLGICDDTSSTAYLSALGILGDALMQCNCKHGGFAPLSDDGSINWNVFENMDTPVEACFCMEELKASDSFLAELAKREGTSIGEERRNIDDDMVPLCANLTAQSDSSDPCFDREVMTACRLTWSASDAAQAYASCFGKHMNQAAGERVLMKELVAGDKVLTSRTSATRIIVNQHVHSMSKSLMLKFHLTNFSIISVTPDHVLFADGEYTPAHHVQKGSMLGELKVEHITKHYAGIINPISADGHILTAATNSSQPVLATTGNEWLADLMLSDYPQRTLTYLLAAIFPQMTQSYYDNILEPFFTLAVPRLACMKASSPPPALSLMIALGDVLLAVGLVSFSFPVLHIFISLLLIKCFCVYNAKM
mmetsp:Transcript_75745/g.126296  ORF Transcript_75745/g.126296 Transcript_75745/m.126296 type:complete len:384 (+) Transcript_75745:37-1188(+)|eukprot:CAMPEP_0119303730 /NCGR_PEP_ID=MMETSP1333-20130426/5107_1 /TAXON_ID=418940 /ORGANISM="Scyphosphaera apsteinii, Strain RCC1455" /LENGTH=383 /DNA_ID=CAMNT_0007306473 /DNA_START=28 /DNA_END=1179 /DNA_ORIENTATION=-